VERASTASRRENAAARRTHRCVRQGRRRRRHTQTRVVGRGQRRWVARVARRSAATLPERGTRDGAVRRRLSGGRHAVPTAPLRHTCGVAGRRRVATTWRWCADRWARRGKWRLTGGPLMSAISDLKFTPG
jgi:hypothetical protein